MIKIKEKPLNSISTQKRINTKRSTPKHRVLKLLTKKKLKAASKKQFIVHIEKHHKNSTDFSSETMEARRQWKVQSDEREKHYQLRILQPETTFQN